MKLNNFDDKTLNEDNNLNAQKNDETPSDNTTTQIDTNNDSITQAPTYLASSYNNNDGEKDSNTANTNDDVNNSFQTQSSTITQAPNYTQKVDIPTYNTVQQSSVTNFESDSSFTEQTVESYSATPPETQSIPSDNPQNLDYNKPALNNTNDSAPAFYSGQTPSYTTPQNVTSYNNSQVPSFPQAEQTTTAYNGTPQTPSYSQAEQTTTAYNATPYIPNSPQGYNNPQVYPYNHVQNPTHSIPNYQQPNNTTQYTGQQPGMPISQAMNQSPYIPQQNPSQNAYAPPHQNHMQHGHLPPPNYGGYPNANLPNGMPTYPSYVKPPKKPMSKGVLALIIVGSVLAFLSIFGFMLVFLIGAFSSLSQTSTITPNPYEYEEFFDEYEDYFGGDGGEFGGFGEDDNDESNPFISPWIEQPDQGEGVEIIEPDNIPDINVPSNSDGITLNGIPRTGELSPEEVYDKVLSSTVSIRAEIHYNEGTVEESMGTGIFITSDGFILTNSHVIGNTKKAYIEITTSNGEIHPAVTVGYDKGTDLAVLKIDGNGYDAAELGSSDDIEIGDWVMALGNPGGEGFSGSLTRGIISGIDRAVGYQSAETMPYIQTDAAINPGNSGGPLVNMYGQVIGINTSKIVAEYFEGMGFAIPTSAAKEIVDDLLENGYVSGRVRLGITARNIDTTTAMFNQIEGGIEIVDIAEDSSFAGTKVQVGDIITAIDGETIYEMTHLSEKLVEYSPGDTIEVTLLRTGEQGSEEITAKIVLLEDNGQTQE